MGVTPGTPWETLAFPSLQKGDQKQLALKLRDNNTHLSKVTCAVRSFREQRAYVHSVLPTNGLASGLVNTDSEVWG